MGNSLNCTSGKSRVRGKHKGMMDDKGTGTRTAFLVALIVLVLVIIVTPFLIFNLFTQEITCVTLTSTVT